MKKALAFLLMMLSLAVYYLSNSARLTEAFTEWRSQRTFMAPAHRGKGDLYNMCFLPEYDIPLRYSLKKALPGKKQLRIYLFCDSYLVGHVEKEHFYGTDSLIKIKWWDALSYRTISRPVGPDKNIIIIELAERFIRDVCVDVSLMTQPLTVANETTVKSAYLAEQEKKSIFNPNINTNLELNLFSYNIFNPARELKSKINYQLFGRIHPEVVVDEKNHFLYYAPTVRGYGKSNAFLPLYSLECESILHTLHKTREHYKNLGFDEVFFAFVPNPASVLLPDFGKYNGLMSFLSTADTSLLPLIDVYPLFRQMPKKYYAPNDSHWNSDGLQAWLDITNRRLKIFLEERQTENEKPGNAEKSGLPEIH